MPGSLKILLKKKKKPCDRKLIYTKPVKILLFVICSFLLLRNDPGEKSIVRISHYPVDVLRCPCPGLDFGDRPYFPQPSQNGGFFLPLRYLASSCSWRRERRSWSHFWCRDVAVSFCRQARSHRENEKRGEKWSQEFLMRIYGKFLLNFWMMVSILSTLEKAILFFCWYIVFVHIEPLKAWA